MSTITLAKDYGLTAERLSGLASGTIIDASSANFIQDNWAGDGGANNAYPFQVVGTSDATIIGGTITGQIDQTTDWRTVYDHGNSAAIRVEDTPNAVIRDWRITDTWDAVRVSWNSQNFMIEDVWVTNARDDAVENDRLQSGTIRDSLFDGVFGGISIDPSSSSPVDGHNETVTLDGVLLRLKPFLYEGEMTHSAFIKTDSATPGTVTPHLRFTNNVIAIEDVNHHSYRSMLDAWAHTVQSSGNFFLNLSDSPLPSDYPKPPAGWTVLQGQAARDYWQNARAEWISNHADGSSPSTPPTPSAVVGNVAVSDVSVTEGNAGTKVATFTVSHTGTAAFSVDFATADGTAAAGSDYASAAGTLKFAAGQTSQTVSVQVNGDTAVEGNETFAVNLANATNGGTITDKTGQGTIVNDDSTQTGPTTPTATVGNISISDASVTEGNSGTSQATFTVSHTGTAAFSVDYATASGTATAGSDFTPASGTLNFTAGQTSQTVTVQVTGDTSTENAETFIINLANAISGTITDGRGMGTIVNDDGAAPPPVDPSVATPTFQGIRFDGTSANETIVGNALDNVINGKQGDDVLMGNAGRDALRSHYGSDTLWGGADSDVFVFQYLTDSRLKTGVDTVMDFTQGDKIDLAMIDSNRDISGDQAFSLTGGSTTSPGYLTISYDAGTDRTTVNGNVDHDAEQEISIMLKGNIPLTAADFFL